MEHTTQFNVGDAVFVVQWGQLLIQKPGEMEEAEVGQGTILSAAGYICHELGKHPEPTERYTVSDRPDFNYVYPKDIYLVLAEAELWVVNRNRRLRNILRKRADEKAKRPESARPR